MPSRATITLRLSSAALVFSGYLALASSRHFGPPILLVPLVFLPLTFLGEWLDGRFPVYRRITNGCTVACPMFLGLSLVFVSLLDAVTALVVYIQIHTLLHRKRPRNYQYLFLSEPYSI